MQFDRLRRRDFITLFGGAAVAWPPAARAQQLDGLRRIGALFGPAETDPEGQARAAALREGLQKLGWTEGRNLHIEYRWAGGADRMRSLAAELVRLNPEVIFAAATSALVALQEATRNIPIVFAQVTDPVGALVAQLRHDSQARQCPVLRQERTQLGQTAMSHFDPHGTLVGLAPFGYPLMCLRCRIEALIGVARAVARWNGGRANGRKRRKSRTMDGDGVSTAPNSAIGRTRLGVRSDHCPSRGWK